MHGSPIRASTTAFLLCSSLQLAASPIYRCAAPGGHITFSHHGCPAEQQQQLQNASPLPGSSPTPIAIPSAKRTPRTVRQDNTWEPTIVGQQDDGCGNRITGRERREAMLKKQVHLGMPRADVESAFGKPDRISSRNGRTSYHYRDNDGNTRQIDFDEYGCVSMKSRK
ncbi:DUF4124 domain-containing protein [Azorhizophilus paspali]|uniref:DUF4124 domain-containing protein n=1 Tax=Azorhizophilus paspali TaxID=69963 RepID=A0ABV6SLE1_AZOPA